MVAGYAAQELASRGLERGQLAIVSADNAPPYKRPPLSKGFLAGDETEESVFINPPAFYTDHGIELRLDSSVERVDTRGRRLHTSTGEEICYERLVVATGSSVRKLKGPGGDLGNIFYLRSLDDSRRIRASAHAGAQAVVVGAGFIGMEVASVLCRAGCEVTMVFPESRTWEALFTPEMSAFFERYYRERGVGLRAGERVVGFAGEGNVNGVRLGSGATLPADLVVAGIGVTPATAMLDGSGLQVDNGVVVDAYLETNAPGVMAAGDVANYYDTLFRKRRRVEHWDNSVEQGKHTARALTGEHEPFVHVPYFFSDVFDLSYEYWGDKEGADRVEYRGDVDDGAFSAWWTRDGRVVAAFIMNRPDAEREEAVHAIEGLAVGV